MKDTIIRGDGTSRTLKAPIDMPESFAEWRAQLLSGIATLDIGLNKAGCEVVGNALDKKNILTDETAALFGLDETAVPDDVLNVIAPVVTGYNNTWKIDKIAEVTLTENTTNFYIKLPQTLSNYPVLLFKMVNLKGYNTTDHHFVAVESTESTEALYGLATFSATREDGNGTNNFKMLYPTLNSDGTVSVEGVVGVRDTKYLYCMGSYYLCAGCHFEIWGAVK